MTVGGQQAASEKCGAWQVHEFPSAKGKAEGMAKWEASETDEILPKRAGCLFGQDSLER